MPPQELRDRQHAQVRLGSGSVVVALLAFVLLRLVVVSVPLGVVAIWLGVRSHRAGGSNATAIVGIVLGALAAVLGLAIGGGAFALQELGARRMPEVVTTHEAALAPRLHAAAEDVYPCQGRADGVDLEGLYTQFPAVGGRPVIALPEATVADVMVHVDGTGYPVKMVKTGDDAWSVNDRDELTRACEAMNNG